MIERTHHVTKLAPGTYDLGAFDCGEQAYNDWLAKSALAAMSAGTCAVYVLVREEQGQVSRVMGYFAIRPTQVVRDDLPTPMQRGAPQWVPGWLLAKLALDKDFQGDKDAQWGSQLLVSALERIVAVADAGGGKVIVVDADNSGLLGFYIGHDFKPTRRTADPDEGLRLFMKVSTARKVLA